MTNEKEVLLKHINQLVKDGAMIREIESDLASSFEVSIDLSENQHVRIGYKNESNEIAIDYISTHASPLTYPNSTYTVAFITSKNDPISARLARAYSILNPETF